MRPLTVLAAAVVLTVSCTASRVDGAAVAGALERQMTTYPESRLQDLYKSFFQDRFGPGHIISDRKSALNYILAELMQAGESTAPYAEPCGWEENYVRVNLAAISDSLITAEALTDALMASAVPVAEDAVAAWKAEWRAIMSIIEKRYPDLPGLQQDRQTLDSLLRSGHYAYHHSDAFNRAYHPHYRIIRKELADSLNLPDN